MRAMKVSHDGGIDWAMAFSVRDRVIGQRLLKEFGTQITEAIGGTGRWALGRVASAVHGSLGSHFGEEIASLAEVIGVEPRDVLLGNLSYDRGNSVGCSTFVVATGNGPLHARNLDWTFPGRFLRDGTTVVHVEGAPAGRYSMVSWPGFFGALTAVAPGRFSVTVNFVSQAGGGPATAGLRALAGYWPVPWAVRRALDECHGFEEAVHFLSTTSLLSAVLLTVAGTREGEGVVIERGPVDFAVRRMKNRRVTVMNHYQSGLYEDENVDLSELDTIERIDALAEELDGLSPMDSSAAFQVLSRADVIGSTTQHQMVMRAAEPMMHVRLPGKRSVGML